MNKKFWEQVGLPFIVVAFLFVGGYFAFHNLVVALIAILTVISLSGLVIWAVNKHFESFPRQFTWEVSALRDVVGILFLIIVIALSGLVGWGSSLYDAGAHAQRGRDQIGIQATATALENHYNNGLQAQETAASRAQATAVAKQHQKDCNLDTKPGKDSSCYQDGTKAGYASGYNAGMRSGNEQTLNGLCPLLNNHLVAKSNGYFFVATSISQTACYGIQHSNGALQLNTGPDRTPYGFLIPVQAGDQLVRAKAGSLIKFYPSLSDAKTQCGHGFDINVESNSYLC